MSAQLSYVQLSSSVNPSFWNKLSELKLNVFKLDSTQKHIWGYFNILSNVSTPFIEVDSTSFNTNISDENQEGYIVFQGKLINKNTVEEFKECDKMKLLNDEGCELYEKIKNGTALQDPSVLNSFIILSFADLKKYHYYYWFAFPVPKDLVAETIESFPISKEFTEKNIGTLYNEYKTLNCKDKSYFVVETDSDIIRLHPLNKTDINNENVKNFYFGFFNISQDQRCIGSQLRNYITLISNSYNFLQGKIVKFLSFSLKRNAGTLSCKESQIFLLKLPELQPGFVPTWVGWEKNERDKMGPRLANMKNTLDPKVLAEDAVDLNLKLMKWNLMPNINLEKIKSTKFLLLGSGTLGCSVARTLLGWGLRDVTFVDNSTVSFSNPVRQSLFTYQDTVDMKPKAIAAADNLKLIFPGVNSKGVQLTIPMPGHTVGDSTLQQVKDGVAEIDKLIKEHDVIFLLMDSRESRWLPTLLGCVYNKIVVNSALGFDSYLVMRHGVKMSNPNPVEISPVKGIKVISGTDLGCYFCNDVTAPGDSVTGRTLDQQCTVTRPGVSQIAGALAAELAISLLQHNEGSSAPAFYSTCGQSIVDTENQSVLGVVPHSIRGFLHSYEQILPATEKYKNCVACSDMIVNQYEKDGIEFLLKVFNDSKYLEDVAMLTDMFKEINFNDVLELSDDDF